MADQSTAGAQTTTEAPATEGQPGAAAPTEGQGTTLLTGDAAATAGGDPAGGDGKPAEGQAPAGEGEGKPEAKAEGAPEKYEFALPDGVALDTAVLDRFDPIFRKLNLTNEQASEFAGAYHELRAAEAKAADEAFVQEAETWVKQVRDDPEIGGQAFDANAKAAQSAIAAFATPEFRELLNVTGLGNHPEVVRFCMRIGKAIAEDKTVRPAGAGGDSRKGDPSILFDHPTSKHAR